MVKSESEIETFEKFNWYIKKNLDGEIFCMGNLDRNKNLDQDNCNCDGQCNCGCHEISFDESFYEDPVVKRLCFMYRELVLHDGFGDLQVLVKILKRGQKEVIIKSGKEYRYVVDVPGELNKWR